MLGVVRYSTDSSANRVVEPEAMGAGCPVFEYVADICEAENNVLKS